MKQSDGTAVITQEDPVHILEVSSRPNLGKDHEEGHKISLLEKRNKK